MQYLAAVRRDNQTKVPAGSVAPSGELHGPNSHGQQVEAVIALRIRLSLSTR